MSVYEIFKKHVEVEILKIGGSREDFKYISKEFLRKVKKNKRSPRNVAMTIVR